MDMVEENDALWHPTALDHAHTLRFHEALRGQMLN